MSATQLSFTLRTSSNVKTVHLVGSWDNYGGQLPLSRDGKAGSWKGTFRFQTSTLKPGSRYWYYYMMDGYHVSHDPAKPATTEPTTGRKLNILDAPNKGGGKSATPRQREAIATGRGLSPSRIVAPKPSKPYASRAVREADYSKSPVDDLCGSLEAASLHTYSVSPPSSVGSSRSSRASGSSSPASLSSLSDTSSGSRCSCKRYGVTRKGDKFLIDCGGRRCGYSDDSSSACSSESNSSESGSGSEIDSSSEDEAPVRRRAPATTKKKAAAAAAVKPRIQTVKPRGATSSRRR